MTQQGDVSLFQTPNDGEINVVDGVVEMSGGLETAAYLSLFGGNEEDPGTGDSPLAYWGNLLENDPVRMDRSETQHLIRSIPATSSNLRRIEDAAKRDLNWLLTEKVASTVVVVASIPAMNRIRLAISIQAVGLLSEFEFTENWSASS